MPPLSSGEKTEKAEKEEEGEGLLTFHTFAWVGAACAVRPWAVSRDDDDGLVWFGCLVGWEDG